MAEDQVGQPEEKDGGGPEKTSKEETGAPTEESPVQLTERAAEAVETVRFSEGFDEDTPLRVGIQGGGCAGFQYLLSFDNKEKKAFDREFYSQGVRILVDEMSLLYLQGVSIDYVETLQATGFKFENPHTTHTCGCGNSFSA